MNLKFQLKDIKKSNEREDKSMLDTKSFLKWPQSDVGERCNRLRVTSFLFKHVFRRIRSTRRGVFFIGLGEAGKKKKSRPKKSAQQIHYTKQWTLWSIRSWAVLVSSAFGTKTNVNCCETFRLVKWQPRWYYKDTKRTTQWGILKLLKKSQQIFLQSKGDLNLTKERITNDVRY